MNRIRDFYSWLSACFRFLCEGEMMGKDFKQFLRTVAFFLAIAVAAVLLTWLVSGCVADNATGVWAAKTDAQGEIKAGRDINFSLAFEIGKEAGAIAAPILAAMGLAARKQRNWAYQAIEKSKSNEAKIEYRQLAGNSIIPGALTNRAVQRAVTKFNRKGSSK